MKAYLDFVHSLNPEALSLSEKARDAVSYTIHHEAGLTKFLDDGNIPPDNSYSERIVKAVALGRRNRLFAMTPDGARTICVFDTFVATARANHANVYYYLKYLIEKAPLIPHSRRSFAIHQPQTGPLRSVWHTLSPDYLIYMTK